ncbi:MAG: peptidoglycan synthetase [Bacteroidetes bacterium]|nr:peptidoglycan synthetase [Bacteroidota bacterium]MBP8753741.1 peptidoglycan synthetase [Chitinophagales bacterium]MBK8682682.1 peptidoglycan synthetase [Bacteroidota bacterium]MBP9189231.1 peptidoglycan synthetase [Chitinophagales bacterium]MBP9547989.1 peptidoglycan synthetase [Chitinophagales bacterium]
MNIHLIAIGGAVMHNLGIALAKKGYNVSGSDDEIFEPSRSRLLQYGLLPETPGWFPEKINQRLDAVILGMHARADNPELLKSKELGLHVYSFPEYIFNQSETKKRVVVCGSHGKTSITSMIMHCLKQSSFDFDYLVGAQLKGFETMVQLSDAPVIIIEGDEYFASPLDQRPKFLHYKPHITVLSGIAWDHFNVFPTWESYLDQFRQLLLSMNKESVLIYNADDKNILQLIEEVNPNFKTIPYSVPQYHVSGNHTTIEVDNNTFNLNVFGKHNMENMAGAAQVCELLNIGKTTFYKNMQNFEGAARRLEVLYQTDSKIVFRDFAHSPSKVKATIDAVKEQYPEKKLIACLELHTYSSLNKNFLPNYANTMLAANERIVYFNPHTLDIKKLPSLSKSDMQGFFNDTDLMVINNSESLLQSLKNAITDNTCLLLMSSGNFNNLNFEQLI